MIQIKKRIVLPISFFMFISYIIFLADTDNLNTWVEIIKVIPYGDKFMHALLYGVMVFLLNYALLFSSINFKIYSIFKKPYYIIRLQKGAILVLFFATIEEFSQHFITVRTFDIGDLFADFIGVILFSLIRIKV